MRIIVVQLGDIHIKSGNPVLSRAQSIRSGVRAAVGNTDEDVYVLAYTGDLAFSGSKEEYDLAEKFCADIQSAFTVSGRLPQEIFIPGNHDLDFRDNNDARPILLESVPEQLDSLKLEGTVVGQIISAQKEFFDFVERRNGRVVPQSERLFYEHNIFLNDMRLCVKCVNTAWMSILEEEPGKLRFPVSLIADSSVCGDIIIALLHHPYGWLEPNNARQLKARLEKTCDLIITGHEHTSSAYRKSLSEKQQLHYVEGAVLYDPSLPRNGFNVIEIDLQERSYSMTECIWEGGSYMPSPNANHPFVRNANRLKSEFSNTDDFSRVLRDPGTPFRHPVQRELKLRDFFIYPDLTKHNSELKPTAEPGTVSSGAVARFFLNHDYVVVVGEEGAGKTSLAKITYEDLQGVTGIIPVLLKGSEFDGFNPKDVARIIKNAYYRQYGEDSYTRFLGLDPALKAVIIDDWQQTKYNPKGQAGLIKELQKNFRKVICFSSDLMEIQQIARSSAGTYSPFASFEFCTIREFGLRLRGALIERWLRLGQEYTLNEVDFLHGVRTTEQKINTVLGKNFVPSYPLFLLTMLQVEDPMAAGGSNLGSYGHLYEVLITRRLAEVSKKATDLGTKYTYISHIAYHMFSRNLHCLGKADLESLHERYCRDYRINLPREATWAQLREAQILSRDGETYRFRYRACYCYFVAKYFQENLANDEAALRLQLNDTADRVYFEDFGNIIIFFVFLTKDMGLIEKILSNARRIYAEYSPADLTKDVEYVDQLLKGILPPIVLPPTAAEENREKYRQQLDENNEPEGMMILPSSDKIIYRDDLDDVVKTAIAIKNLRIMGQILRNFPGVLKGGPKRELAEECYMLGLRTLKRFLTIGRDNLSELRTLYAEIIREHRALDSDAEVIKAADEALVWVTRMASFGVIKRVSSAVGLEELELTYREVRDLHSGTNVSVDLIDVAIKMDHFKECPDQDLDELKRRIPNDSFAFTILRDFVADYLYLFVSDQRTLQKYGSMFQISTSSPQFKLNKKTSKMLIN
jgi:calcineurin-like phosphoesterase family protein